MAEIEVMVQQWKVIFENLIIKTACGDNCQIEKLAPLRFEYRSFENQELPGCGKPKSF